MKLLGNLSSHLFILMKGDLMHPRKVKIVVIFSIEGDIMAWFENHYHISCFQWASGCLGNIISSRSVDKNRGSIVGNKAMIKNSITPRAHPSSRYAKHEFHNSTPTFPPPEGFYDPNTFPARERIFLLNLDYVYMRR